MSTFVDEVGEEQERNSPVRAAVKSAAADIQAARQAGKPLNAIFRALKRKGLKVGKGYSSFRNAVVHLIRTAGRTRRPNLRPRQRPPLATGL